MRTPVIISALFLAASAALLCSACASTAPKSDSDREVLGIESRDAVERFKRQDPSLEEVLDNAVGYAIFPTIGKGAVGVGGAYGRGELFERGRMVGYCDVTQGSIGFQLGGQSFMELIVFNTESAIERFKDGRFEFSANASAVAVRSGAAKAANFDDGVAVFTATKAGLMFEAAIGGQKFTFEPLDRATRDLDRDRDRQRN